MRRLQNFQPSFCPIPSPAAVSHEAWHLFLFEEVEAFSWICMKCLVKFEMCSQEPLRHVNSQRLGGQLRFFGFLLKSRFPILSLLYVFLCNMTLMLSVNSSSSHHQILSRALSGPSAPGSVPAVRATSSSGMPDTGAPCHSVTGRVSVKIRVI